jgi:hypothetical protein
MISKKHKSAPVTACENVLSETSLSATCFGSDTPAMVQLEKILGPGLSLWKEH